MASRPTPPAGNCEAPRVHIPHDTVTPQAQSRDQNQTQRSEKRNDYQVRAPGAAASSPPWGPGWGSRTRAEIRGALGARGAGPRDHLRGGALPPVPAQGPGGGFKGIQEPAPGQSQIPNHPPQQKEAASPPRRSLLGAGPEGRRPDRGPSELCVRDKEAEADLAQEFPARCAPAGPLPRPRSPERVVARPLSPSGPAAAPPLLPTSFPWARGGGAAAGAVAACDRGPGAEDQPGPALRCGYAACAPRGAARALGAGVRGAGLAAGAPGREARGCPLPAPPPLRRGKPPAGPKSAG
uniref:basic proline-rich protein-like n=1 Tax=Odobenus rosmarus divergens TaxID=9708 RepID=UPI00063C3DEE|nr:PREDICTED: basic proline-rich protein-like [Odobenus rosmarus divergens]